MATNKKELSPLEQAFYLLSKAESKIKKLEKARSEPIAIIGMGCRFPGGANDPETYWKLLSQGYDAISEVPKERWNIDDYYDPNPDAPGKMYTRFGGFLNVPYDLFDAPFFRISSKEAEMMDPQQRLLLEVAWESLERAGINPKSLVGSRTGVFIGQCTRDFDNLLSAYASENEINFYSNTGNAMSILAGRLSFFLGLQGPSMMLDTACSSSLSAVHLACLSLHANESDLALVGGVNLILKPDYHITFCKAHALAPDGHCKTFDKNADGYVRSEGCGVLVLKPLSKALQDNDPILAVIRTTAVNHDGASSGLTAPNGEAQATLIRSALESAQLDPDAIDIIETHGSGTPLGDPIEVNALTSVFGHRKSAPLMIGAVKTNIGHLEAGAGVAGLIKIILSLQHEAIPPNLNFHELNPHILLDAIPAQIPLKLTPWPRGNRPRLAGINAFGYSGTNAHVILEEAPQQEKQKNEIDRPMHLIALSAKDEQALQQLVDNYVQSKPAGSLTDIAFTANTGRDHFNTRIAIAAHSSEEFLTKLQAKDYQVSQAPTKVPKITFLFAGQGAQYPKMGKQLYDTQPVFKAAIDRCAEILKDYIDTPLIDLIFQSEGKLDQTGNTQPALFAFEYALAVLWASWGIKPDYVMGHSAGEYVAATVAGILSLEDGLKLISARARLMQTLPPGGAMAALAVDLDSIQQAMVQCGAEVEIGAINGPIATVISGKEEDVNKILEFFQAKNIKTHRLHVSIASHSKLMDPILDEFGKIAQTFHYQPSTTAFISNLTGRIMRSDEFTPAYWTDHIRNPVRFYEGIKLAHEKGGDLFLEVGPHPVLAGMGSQCLPQDVGLWLPSLRRDHDDWETILESVGQLYQAGVRIDWNGFDAPYHRTKVILPTYPFQRQRYWPKMLSKKQKGVQRHGGHTLLGEYLESASHEKIFENTLDLDALSYLKDHQVFNSVIFPGAGYVEILLAAGRQLLKRDALAIENLSIQAPLPLSEENPSLIQVIADPENRLSIYSRDDQGNWKCHATANVQSKMPSQTVLDVDELKKHCPTSVSLTDFYERYAAKGLNYGPHFQALKQLWVGNDEIFAELHVPDDISSMCDPRLLDGCFQTLLAKDNDSIYLPVGIDKLSCYASLPSIIRMHGKVTEKTDFSLTADLEIISTNGDLLVEIRGFHALKPNREQFQRSLEGENQIKKWFYQISWQKQPLKSSSEVKAPSVYLIGSEGNELTHAVISLLQGKGTKCHLFGPEDTNSFETLLSQYPNAGILYLSNNMKGALHLSQALVETPSLGFITTGAQPVPPTNVQMTQTPFVGFYRSFALEHPELACFHVDLDPEASFEQNSSNLIEELFQRDNEDQIAYRKGVRYVPRILHLKDMQRSGKQLLSPPKPYRLETTTKGDLESLLLKPFHFKEVLKPHELIVDVKAAGLNFRDVLNATGLYPGDPGLMGNEFAGVVSQVGKEVTHFKVGDAIMGFTQGCFASQATVDEDLCCMKPSNLNFTEAATIPIVFATAYIALHELAKLKAGEKILIHAATGGVGLAAIQIAKQLGAVIYATASSKEKHAYLREIGVKNVYNSRSLDYAEAILRDTNGQGVDVVLNSLSGEGFIAKSLEACHQNARFVEIGKRDIWTQEEMSKTRPDISYFILALDTIIANEPKKAQRALNEALADFDKGHLKPLPMTNFKINDALSAFEYLRGAKQIGKVVITLPEEKKLHINPQGSYLITGGFGALGLKIAEWLISKGAKHLVLVGRKIPPEPSINAPGVKIEAVSCDISKEQEVNTLIQNFGQSWPELKGVIHAAGVLHDASLEGQTWAYFEEVFAPKVTGGWLLHQATISKPLDFCVYFSSLASFIGNAGQTNYSAANAYLDALAYYRQQLGLPAQSICWGPWGNIGLAAKLAEQHRLAGFNPFDPELGIKALESLMQTDIPQVLAADINWTLFIEHQGRKFQWFTELIPTPQKIEAKVSLIQQLQMANPMDREKVLREHIQKALRKVLGLTSTQMLKDDQGFFDRGLDSLMAVQLKNQLQTDIGTLPKLPATLTFDHPTVNALTEFLLNLLIPKEEVKEEEIIDLQTQQIEPIAIVGMGCRFPGGANKPDSFWQLLEKGYDGIKEIPKDRWNVDEFYDPNPDTPGKMYVRSGGFLDLPIDQFDPEFFGISPREAELMDAQQRLLLEVTWEALEQGGIDPSKLKDSLTGVFVGASSHDYHDLLTKLAPETSIDAYQVTGYATSVLTGRISYILGLRGPSMPVDTACSSSLVALHLACQSLREDECNLALVGGVNLLLSPYVFIEMCKSKMLSPEGHCKTFDAQADGFARGEGCGVVVLKRLSDALKDNDRILALIKGTGVNHDGVSSGLTVPSSISQEALLKKVWGKAHIKASQIDYFEAHGTGTSLGDPIEIQALISTFKNHPRAPLWIGSVKTNIGHLESAAGIAGLIKLILALQNETIPPHINFTSLNPFISLDAIPAKIPLQAIPWKHSEKSRIAAISSFGIGGTNAHAILEEAPLPEKKPSPSDRPLHLLALSAKTEKALKEIIASYIIFLKTHPDASLADIAYTANAGRAHFKHRLALTATSTDELLKKLETIQGVIVDKTPPIVFVFPGHEGLLQTEFYTTQPTFKTAFDQCATQSFALEYAFYQLLKSWGIKPDYVMGHGYGEYVAAIAAGLMTLENAHKLISGDKINYQSPTSKFISSLTGKVLGKESLNDDYWINLLHRPPKSLPQELEGAILINIDSKLNWNSLMNLVANLYMKGINVDWKEFDAPYARNKISLPAYPFQRQSYWPKNLIPSGHRTEILQPPLNSREGPRLLTLLEISDEREKILQNHIQNTLKKVLHLPDNRDLDVNQNFFDWGINSIMAVEFRNHLQNDFENLYSFPSTLIFEHPTISQLAKYIDNLLTQKPSSNNQEPFNPKSLLVPIQTHGSHAPLFCIHPVGGDIFYYVDLAKTLGPEYPLYAIRAKGLENHEIPHETLQTRIEDYIAAIKSVQPQGPYYILGWSGGSVIASRLLAKFQQQGEEINTLFFIEVPNVQVQKPNYIKLFLDFINKESGVNIEITTEEFNTLETEKILNILLKRAKAIHIFSIELDEKDFTRRYEVFKNNVEHINTAMKEFKVNNIKNACIFKSKIGLLETLGYSYNADYFDPDLDSKFSDIEHLEKIVLTCNHFEIIKEPYISLISNKIKSYIPETVNIL